METLHTMNSLFSKLRPLTSNGISNLKPFCTSYYLISPQPLGSSRRNSSRVRATTKVAVNATELKENWLDSLTSPLPHNKITKNQISHCVGGTDDNLGPSNESSSYCVIGIDPDLSGALALLKVDHSGCSAQVFDTPHLKVLIGKKVRKRLNAKSIVQLLHSFNAPIGTTAYIEQSLPFPQDGKQGWWSGGFGYGLWIGVLVASGFSVVPVPSFTWKNEFELSGENYTKDDSRRIASTLFPSLSTSLNRKKDHGRAEALLIAAYGNNRRMKSTPTCDSEELP